MEYLRRTLVIPLDPGPGQDQLLRSYAGAARKAHTWVLVEVSANLDVRATERKNGCIDEELTPSLCWHIFAFSPRFNT
jgi:hypothetical protein